MSIRTDSEQISSPEENAGHAQTKQSRELCDARRVPQSKRRIILEEATIQQLARIEPEKNAELMGFVLCAERSKPQGDSLALDARKRPMSRRSATRERKWPWESAETAQRKRLKERDYALHVT
jgi:hypothetical protein